MARAGPAPVSREYRGREEIFDLFRETRRLTDGTYRASCAGRSPTASTRVAVYRARGRGTGREIDIDQVLLITLRDGRWQEIVAVPTDPQAFEAFWAADGSRPALVTIPSRHARADRPRRD